jgi:hypothetical protein
MPVERAGQRQRHQEGPQLLRGLWQGELHLQRQLLGGRQRLNSGAPGTYASIVGKAIAPSTWFGTSGIGMYVSGEFGRQWLGTSDSFYGVPAFPNGINYADYNTWNVGIGFTYKVFTLDFRYSDTNLSKGDCNAFTSDFSARGNLTVSSGTFVTPINPTGVGSNWCGAAGIVKLSADLTAMTNLK